MSGTGIQTSTGQGLLAATGVIAMADTHDRAVFAKVTKMKEEPMDVETLENKDEVGIKIINRQLQWIFKNR